MAPNITGVAAVDQSASAALAATALEFSRRVLRRGGALLVKVFQGPELQQLRREMEQSFPTVLVRKPEASRSRSAEVYLLARGYRPPASSGG
jgi:23S rRNA (uridine2552-2'-O)-methyltransferase